MRVSTTGVAYLDHIAHVEGVDRSEIVRRALSEYTARWLHAHGEPPTPQDGR